MPLSACGSLITMRSTSCAVSAREPTSRLRCGVVPDVLDLLIFREPGGTELATVARLAEAAPLRRGGVVAEIVEPDRSVPQCTYDAFATCRIGCPNSRGETVFRVVAEGD